MASAAGVKMFGVHVAHPGLDLLVRVALATLLGVTIGLERQWRSRMSNDQNLWMSLGEGRESGRTFPGDDLKVQLL